MVKKGDTLIEVTLAVGIFSMVAIAIVAVMSGGTSSSQTALETTLAREEIDTQAEALRFIQSSYISDKKLEDARYTKLWQAITSKALTVNEANADAAKALLQFAPKTCEELYDKSAASSIFTDKAFVINPRKLGSFTAANINDVFISTTNEDNATKFAQTTTYPHLVYSKNNSTSDSANMITSEAYTNLYQALGIYVIAVKDTSKTSIYTDSGINKQSAFYDFYIRTCWYGTNANEPSTISTVIRLYDPSVVQEEGD